MDGVDCYGPPMFFRLESVPVFFSADHRVSSVVSAWFLGNAYAHAA